MTTIAPAQPLTAREAREQLAAEWRAADPQTPAQIMDFYRSAEHMGADLEAFHANPMRQEWTSALVQTAQQFLTTNPTKNYIDIGCGLGHDLRAVREVVPDATVIGVEPNDRLTLTCYPFTVYSDVEDAPIEEADLISCFDVLEHVPNPEEWLGAIARRCKVGAVLLETCATFDLGTPLHLKENAGWHPGRILEETGWEHIGGVNRVRFWQKREAKIMHTGLMLCAYRGVSTDTFLSILDLLDKKNDVGFGWRVSTSGEAGINRSRSVLTSRWYREMADDVFLMVDDDIIFKPSDAQRIVDLCRNGHDVICAAYPVRDGAHLAVRGYEENGSWVFGPGQEPVEVRWGSTGFFAVHRRVVEAMVPTLPLCHASQPFSFWPFFDFKIVEDEPSGGFNYLSEDWNFCQNALDLGFKVWLDPSIVLGHLGTVPLHVGNMGAIHAAITQPGPGQVQG